MVKEDFVKHVTFAHLLKQKREREVSKKEILIRFEYLSDSFVTNPALKEGIYYWRRQHKDVTIWSGRKAKMLETRRRQRKLHIF